MSNNLIDKYDTVVFFDTETTGLDYNNCQIIELAAYTVSSRYPDYQMDEFINLHTVDKLPNNIINLTGITDDIITKNGNSEEDVLQKFFSLWKDNDKTLLVAHNAQFDLNFLKSAIDRYPDKNWKDKLDACNFCDTLTVYRDISSYPHKLADAIEEYDISGKVQNSHRAIDDCIALYEVTKKMGEHTDLTRYVNLFGVHPKYGISGKKINGVTYKDQPLDNFYTGKKVYDGIKKEEKAIKEK